MKRLLSTSAIILSFISFPDKAGAKTFFEFLEDAKDFIWRGYKKTPAAATQEKMRSTDNVYDALGKDDSIAMKTLQKTQALEMIHYSPSLSEALGQNEKPVPFNLSRSMSLAAYNTGGTISDGILLAFGEIKSWLDDSAFYSQSSFSKSSSPALVAVDSLRQNECESESVSTGKGLPQTIAEGGSARASFLAYAFALSLEDGQREEAEDLSDERLLRTRRYGPSKQEKFWRERVADRDAAHRIAKHPYRGFVNVKKDNGKPAGDLEEGRKLLYRVQ